MTVPNLLPFRELEGLQLSIIERVLVQLSRMHAMGKYKVPGAEIWQTQIRLPVGVRGLDGALDCGPRSS